MASKKKLIRWFAVLGYMAVIFIFSGHSGETSQWLSRGIVQEVKGFVDGVLNLESPAQRSGIDYNYILRKTAHFAEYMILVLLLWRALVFVKVKLPSRIVITFAVSFMFSALDEYHQSFVPGRSALFKDIIIDTLGACTGILILLSLKLCRRTRKRR